MARLRTDGDSGTRDLVTRLTHDRHPCSVCGREMAWGDPYRAMYPGGHWLDAPHNRWYCTPCDNAEYARRRAALAQQQRRERLIRRVRALAAGALALGVAATPWFLQSVTITRIYGTALTATVSTWLALMVYQRALSACAERRPFGEGFDLRKRVERVRPWSHVALAAASVAAVGLLASLGGR